MNATKEMLSAPVFDKTAGIMDALLAGKISNPQLLSGLSEGLVASKIPVKNLAISSGLGALTGETTRRLLPTLSRNHPKKAKALSSIVGGAFGGIPGLASSLVASNVPAVANAKLLDAYKKIGLTTGVGLGTELSMAPILKQHGAKFLDPQVAGKLGTGFMTSTPRTAAGIAGGSLLTRASLNRLGLGKYMEPFTFKKGGDIFLDTGIGLIASGNPILGATSALAAPLKNTKSRQYLADVVKELKRGREIEQLYKKSSYSDNSIKLAAPVFLTKPEYILDAPSLEKLANPAASFFKNITKTFRNTANRLTPGKIPKVRNTLNFNNPFRDFKPPTPKASLPKIQPSETISSTPFESMGFKPTELRQALKEPRLPSSQPNRAPHGAIRVNAPKPVPSHTIGHTTLSDIATVKPPQAQPNISRAPQGLPQASKTQAPAPQTMVGGPAPQQTVVGPPRPAQQSLTSPPVARPQGPSTSATDMGTIYQTPALTAPTQAAQANKVQKLQQFIRGRQGELDVLKAKSNPTTQDLLNIRILETRISILNKDLARVQAPGAASTAEKIFVVGKSGPRISDINLRQGERGSTTGPSITENIRLNPGERGSTTGPYMGMEAPTLKPTLRTNPMDAPPTLRTNPMDASPTLRTNPMEAPPTLMSEPIKAQAQARRDFMSAPVEAPGSARELRTTRFNTSAPERVSTESGNLGVFNTGASAGLKGTSPAESNFIANNDLLPAGYSEAMSGIFGRQKGSLLTGRTEARQVMKDSGLGKVLSKSETVAKESIPGLYGGPNALSQEITQPAHKLVQNFLTNNKATSQEILSQADKMGPEVKNLVDAALKNPAVTKQKEALIAASNNFTRRMEGKVSVGLAERSDKITTSINKALTSNSRKYKNLSEANRQDASNIVTSINKAGLNGTPEGTAVLSLVDDAIKSNNPAEIERAIESMSQLLQGKAVDVSTLGASKDWVKTFGRIFGEGPRSGTITFSRKSINKLETLGVKSKPAIELDLKKNFTADNLDRIERHFEANSSVVQKLKGLEASDSGPAIINKVLKGESRVADFSNKELKALGVAEFSASPNLQSAYNGVSKNGENSLSKTLDNIDGQIKKLRKTKKKQQGIPQDKQREIQELRALRDEINNHSSSVQSTIDDLNNQVMAARQKYLEQDVGSMFVVPDEIKDQALRQIQTTGFGGAKGVAAGTAGVGGAAYLGAGNPEAGQYFQAPVQQPMQGTASYLSSPLAAPVLRNKVAKMQAPIKPMKFKPNDYLQPPVMKPEDIPVESPLTSQYLASMMSAPVGA